MIVRLRQELEPAACFHYFKYKIVALVFTDQTLYMLLDSLQTDLFAGIGK
jgi:hypothetical protein